MLIKTVHLPGEADYYSQMLMHNSSENTDISLARKFKEYISDPTRAHGLLDQGKYRRLDSKFKWTDREYHVQHRKYLPQTSVKMSCYKTQVPELTFYSPNTKHHGVKGVK